MRLSKLALFVGLSSAILLTPAYARGGGGHGGGGHVGSGAVRGGFSGAGAIPGGPGVSGFRGGYGYDGGRYYGPSLYFGVAGYPYYGPWYGAYGYDPYSYGYDPYAYGGGSAYPPPATVPENYGYPTQGQNQPAQPPASTQTQAANGGDQGQNFYLIAFTDHSIQAATAYKIEGDQFYWITREGDEKQAPLSSVDIAFSQQINRDRHVGLRIP
jgi:hypothetical protein